MKVIRSKDLFTITSEVDARGQVRVAFANGAAFTGKTLNLEIRPNPGTGDWYSTGINPAAAGAYVINTRAGCEYRFAEAGAITALDLPVLIF